jgi:hypothetical protein
MKRMLWQICLLGLGLELSQAKAEGFYLQGNIGAPTLKFGVGYDWPLAEQPFQYPGQAPNESNGVRQFGVSLAAAYAPAPARWNSSSFSLVGSFWGTAPTRLDGIRMRSVSSVTIGILPNMQYKNKDGGQVNKIGYTAGAGAGFYLDFNPQWSAGVDMGYSFTIINGDIDPLRGFFDVLLLSGIEAQFSIVYRF